jgi:hypothetical protein
MFFEEKLKDVPEIAASHHEKFNGSGYFRKLAGNEIYRGGRILAVSDVFDAITSKRHYRDRMPFVNVLNILKKDSGTHFDPEVVDNFFALSILKVLNILLYREDYEITEDARGLFEKYTLNDFHELLLKEEDKRSAKENKIIEFFETLYNPEKNNV